MEFRIADTFTDSLTKLTSQEQKAVKTTAFDLQLNPASAGMRFHKLDRVRDPNFWSVSVNMDIRLIVHRTDTSLLLCYVDHHDDAYTWASRRKIERHPKTGAAQLVEIRETVEEVIIQKSVERATTQPQKPLLFAQVPDEDLLNYGIPVEWLADVKHATEDTLFDIADHLPQEATEALLELAIGGNPQPLKPSTIPINPFDHPDAQRRFRIMSNSEELERALAYPWEKWTVFLHPSQRSLVERNYSGPARISGSAGTGKTIVGLHRAVFLARQHPTAQLLLTTFSPALANALRIKLNRLVGNQPDIINRIQVGAIQDIVRKLYTDTFGSPTIADPKQVRSRLIRGRSQTLTINYRTSHQIRTSADRLLPNSITDVDGNQEQRRITVSVFDGPAPAIEIYADPDNEIASVSQWIAHHLKAGIQPEEIGVFVRDRPQLKRAIAAITQAGASPLELDEQIASADGCISVSTMHLAKGPEFRAVAVMACDDEVLPLQSRIEAIADESE